MTHEIPQLVPLQPDHTFQGFLPLPRSLLRAGLSPLALVLYALLLDRGTLSQKNGWEDPDGVYVVYPNEHLSKDLGKSVSTVKNTIRELERFGLVLRKTSREGRANHICLRVPGELLAQPKAADPAPKPRRKYSRTSQPAVSPLASDDIGWLIARQKAAAQPGEDNFFSGG